MIIWKRDGAEYLKRISDVTDEDLKGAYGGYILASDKALALAWIIKDKKVEIAAPRKVSQAIPHKAVPTQKLELSEIPTPKL